MPSPELRNLLCPSSSYSAHWRYRKLFPRVF